MVGSRVVRSTKSGLRKSPVSGAGLAARASVTYGQYSKGAQLSFVEPYFLGYRVALGWDIFAKQQLPTNFISYQTDTVGGNLRLGFALREDLSLQLRYSLYQQKIKLPDISVTALMTTVSKKAMASSLGVSS